MPLRVIFMGTPEFAVPTLIEIIGHGHQVVAVYTQPPRPAGRGMGERPSPVHRQALAFDIPVQTPRTLRDAAVQAEFAAHRADVAVVVAYGLILPPAVLQAPADGCINLHASLLPRWRGAAPIQRALMAGDRETGVMLMRMEEGLDTGPVCLAERVPIGPADNAGTLHDRLAGLGADLAVRGLAALERGALTCARQGEAGATYAAKIDKAETRIDWTRPASEVHNQVRGLAPAPGAWFALTLDGAPERVKLLRSEPIEGTGVPGAIIGVEPFSVACGDGALRLLELQRAGRRAVPAEEFCRGTRIAPGLVLG